MNTTIRSYQDLTAWQKARTFATAVYQATQSWPREELYGLTPPRGLRPRQPRGLRAGQVRRAAVSVAANIAEPLVCAALSTGRFGANEFLHPASGPDGPQCFALSGLSIATGSLTETETLLLIAQDLDYITAEHTQRLLTQSNAVGQLIGGLRRSLRPTTERRTPPAAHETRDRPA